MRSSLKCVCLLIQRKKIELNIIKYRSLFLSNNLLILNARDADIANKEQALILRQSDLFDHVLKKSNDKKAFQEALEIFLKKNPVYRRGYVEFLYAAIGKMQLFNVHRDLETYKSLLNIFPKHVMVARSAWQIELMHYPKQQTCCIDILEHMEINGVIPDDEIGYHIIELFGEDSFVMRRYKRMMYWMPKFRYSNPYYIPFNLPDSHLELAKMALKRILVDLESKICTFNTKELSPHCSDDTFIVSGTSPKQVSFINSHDINMPLIVEGPFIMWLRMYSMPYFLLRTEGPSKDKVLFEEKLQRAKEISDKRLDEDFTLFKYDEESTDKIVKRPTDHELETTTILGISVPGVVSKDIAALWINGLQETIPALSQIPILFRLRSSTDFDKHLFFQDVTAPIKDEDEHIMLT